MTGDADAVNVGEAVSLGDAAGPAAEGDQVPRVPGAQGQDDIAVLAADDVAEGATESGNVAVPGAVGAALLGIRRG